MSDSRRGLIVLGSGGHAKVVIRILEALGTWQISGVVTKDPLESFMGYPVLGDPEALPTLVGQGHRTAAIGVGGYRSNELRRRVYERAVALDVKVVSALHPTAVVSEDTSVGVGSVVFAGAVLNPEVRLGQNVVVAFMPRLN